MTDGKERPAKPGHQEIPALRRAGVSEVVYLNGTDARAGMLGQDDLPDGSLGETDEYADQDAARYGRGHGDIPIKLAPRPGVFIGMLNGLLVVATMAGIAALIWVSLS